VKTTQSGVLLLIILYVGDLIFIGSNVYKIKLIKDTIPQAFDMENHGVLLYYIDMELWQK
jgi:hypothetical protein